MSPLLIVAALSLASQAQPRAQAPTTTNRPPSAEQAVVDALRANPMILPYAIRVTSDRGGSIVLSGRVGTKQVHDLAIRTVIEMGLVPRDDLIIDTAEAHRVAVDQSAGAAAAGGGSGGSAPSATAPVGPAPYFVYPEPLFGRLDDPFFGFEPPILSFPPGYVRRDPLANIPPPGSAPLQRGAGPVKGKIQLSVDEFGQVSISGDVASEADRRTIEEQARSVPGVTRLSSNLRVVDQSQPPPPPRPFLGPDGRAEVSPATDPSAAEAPAEEAAPARAGRELPIPIEVGPTARDDRPVTARAVQSLQRRPNLKNAPIDVRSSDDVVTIGGKVPSAYEAMLAFRAVEQTPGVDRVVDKLNFPLPDENQPNPLRRQARPDDLEPYLLNQIRRHLGDVAHVDQVRVLGDVVEVRGVLGPGESQDRIAAVLRSIALLRDFKVEPNFQAD